MPGGARSRRRRGGGAAAASRSGRSSRLAATRRPSSAGRRRLRRGRGSSCGRATPSSTGTRAPAAARPGRGRRAGSSLPGAARRPRPPARARSRARTDWPPTRPGSNPLRGAARDLTVAGAALAALPGGPLNVSALVLSGLAEAGALWAPRRIPATGVFRFRKRGRGAGHGAARLLPIPRRPSRRYSRARGPRPHDLRVRAGGMGTAAHARGDLALPARATARGEPRRRAGRLRALRGSGIRPGVRLTSASVLDLAPTLLVLAGEPIARDMDGRVLAEVFDERFTESASIPIVTTFEPSGPQ